MPGDVLRTIDASTEEMALECRFLKTGYPTLQATLGTLRRGFLILGSRGKVVNQEIEIDVL